jgi:hypothetical protein
MGNWCFMPTTKYKLHKSDSIQHPWVVMLSRNMVQWPQMVSRWWGLMVWGLPPMVGTCWLIPLGVGVVWGGAVFGQVPLKKCKGRNWPNAHGQCCKPGEEGLNYHHRPRQLVILRFNQLPHLLCTSVFQSLGWILLSPQTLHTNCLLDLWMISENFFEGRFGFLSKNASR